jgi:putative PIN family toxin of toxin-antitoxin system
MIRAVLDTNVVVSALLRSGGLPDAIFNLAINGEIQLCVSEPILAGYEEVLRRPRLAIHPDKVTIALARIRAVALMVQPGTPVTVALDPDDNMFLECADAAQAHCLVTGNAKHFPDRWQATQILTPRQFMDARALAADTLI